MKEQSTDSKKMLCLVMNHWSYLDGRLVPKISKRHFFWGIQNSSHGVADIGLEPHQFFSFWNISTNMVARGVQSFGQNGPWWAGCLKYGQNFLIKFAQTYDTHMLMFIMSLCKFDQESLVITQAACQAWPGKNFGRLLHFFRYSKKKEFGEVLDLYE